MKKILAYNICFILLLSSCNSWLDVKPKTAIQEKDIFESESGFKDVLTGVYISLGSTSMYGRTLSMEFLDRLARRYDYPLIPDYTALYQYNGSYESTCGNIWGNMYNQIANINNLIKFCDRNRHVIKTDDYYEIIKGESYGLRAFLHFELLRMFGPIYYKDPNDKSICYRTELNKYATALLPATQVVDSIESDLLKAQALLDSHDSEVFESNEFDIDQDAFLRLRQLRMNKFAVKALLARLYCYKGDAESKDLACKYAKDVINSGHFELMVSNSSNPILFQEHIFSLHVYELDKIVKNIYELSRGDNNLSISKNTLDDMYGSDLVSKDMRRNENSFKTGSGDVRITLKYNQSYYSEEYNGKEIVPLIRLPEMYYIIAECETNPDKSLEALEIVRKTRLAEGKLPTASSWDRLGTASTLTLDLLQTNRTNEIMKEYLREYYAEGQLFYFYKNHNYRSIYPNVKMEPSYYIFKIPNDESIFGNNN